MQAINTKWDFLRKVPLNDSNFRKILQFYLFESPAPGVSVRGKGFREHGWQGSTDFGALKSEMLRRSHSLRKKNYVSTSAQDLPLALQCQGLDKPSTVAEERAVFFKRDSPGYGVMESLFAAIRHALAHGRFDLHTYDGDRVYCLENRKSGNLRARMILRESTLLAWIDIVSSGPSALPDKKSSKNRKQKP